MGYIILCEDPQNRVGPTWRTKSEDYGHVYGDPITCIKDIDLLNSSAVSMEVDHDLHYSLGVHDATD